MVREVECYPDNWERGRLRSLGQVSAGLTEAGGRDRGKAPRCIAAAFNLGKVALEAPFLAPFRQQPGPTPLLFRQMKPERAESAFSWQLSINHRRFLASNSYTTLS
jgi:hypothetical protein